MDTFLQDVRYAARTLRRSPGFTAIAVLCLALGIGVNTTIFSVVNAILLKPFPFEDPERLVYAQSLHPRFGYDAGTSYLNLQDWRAGTTSFEQMAATSGRSLVITEGEEPERLTGGVVTWNLFPMLGVRPMLGRGFREDEDQPGAPGVVLLSHELWQRRYNGDSSVVGRTISINTLPHTVVGVMPVGFKFPSEQELWVPLAPLHHADLRGSFNLGVFARLKPGVTVEQARADLAGVQARLEQQFPENKGWSAEALPLRKEFIPEDVRLITLTMMGAVTFVLLIACANVANLMLARASARQREIAIRSAVGAGRGRIVRQLLTESVMVAIAAGLIGVPLAWAGLHMLDAAIPPQDALPYYIDWKIDRPTLVYTLVVSVLTGVVFGLAPALQAGRGSLQGTLRDGGRGSGSGAGKARLRSSLVVAEIALSLVLLVGASLFVRSFMKLEGNSGGIDTGPLLSMRFYLPGERYDSLPARVLRSEDIVRRVEGLPGVQAAAASNNIPLSGGGSYSNVMAEGQAYGEGEEPGVFWTGVTAHWFRTIGVSLVSGRDLTELEASDSSAVAVVNQSMARKLFPNGDALGRRFRFKDDSSAHWITVVGIVPDYSNDDIDAQNEERASAYLPLPYLSGRNTGLVVRTAGDPVQLASAVRRALRESDPSIAVFDLASLEEVRRSGYWQFKLFGQMFGVFGGIALFLAAIGVYGVISYGVHQRTQEIGVRVALGAQRRDVLQLVVGNGLRLAAFGVGIGVAGALAVTRVVRSLLYEVSPSDPTSFLLVAGFLTAVAIVASYLPARRATSVDPLTALRSE